MDRQFDSSAGPPVATHNPDLAMQEYLSLHDQREELCQRLYELSPSSTITLSISSTAVTSPSVSPTRSFLSADGPRPSKLSPSPSRDPRRTSHTWMSSPGSRTGAGQREPVRDELLVGEVAAGEQKLFDVNEGMKRALTELLNCEAVRRDRAMRTWVQTRLLETEKELRRGRRRRSSATVD